MALKGRIGRLQELLQDPNKADINALSGPYGTPLGAACAPNRIGSVRCLMEHGADLNYSNTASSCPLVLGCLNGNVEVVRLLVRAGAVVNILSTEFGLTPLEAASRQGHKDIVEMLLVRVKKDRAGDTSRQKHLNSALQIACAGGHETVVHLLLNEGADASLCGELPFGSALTAACSRAHHANEVSIEEKLRRRGANVNYNGHTSALAAACGRGNLFVVEKLLKWGAEINATPKLPEESENRSALAAACENGHLPVVRLLLAKGADVNLPLSRPSRSTERAWLGDNMYKTVGRADRSALHHACTSGNAEIVKLLLGKGAQIDFTIIPNNSFTPEILSLLRDAGVQYSQPIVGARSKLDNSIDRVRNKWKADAKRITPTDEHHVMLADGRLDFSYLRHIVGPWRLGSPLQLYIESSPRTISQARIDPYNRRKV